jgi:hypothetical protein
VRIQSYSIFDLVRFAAKITPAVATPALKKIAYVHSKTDHILLLVCIVRVRVVETLFGPMWIEGVLLMCRTYQLYVCPRDMDQ